MVNKKDLTPYNEKGEEHGYWERYHSNGQLWYKGNYVNGIRDGHFEFYSINGKLYSKGSYVNDKKVGLWIEGDKKVFYG